jgi:hypothetical protein
MKCSRVLDIIWIEQIYAVFTSKGCQSTKARKQVVVAWQSFEGKTALYTV